MEKKINRGILITAACALLFVGIALLFRNAPHDTAVSEDRLFELCEYIDVDLLRLDVNIFPYEGDKIRICYRNDLPLEIERGDNRLDISESDRFVISLFAGSGSDFGLDIYLPQTSYRELSVSTGSGDVNIGRVDSSKLNVVTESGSVTCRDTVSLCSITTTDGFISADFEAVMNGCEILSRKGNAEIFIPSRSSVAVNFETETGECITDLYDGQIFGSFRYSWSGGDKRINAAIQQGRLTISERTE